MKILFLYLLILAFSVSIAQNNLRVYSANGEVFKLSVNNTQSNAHEQANVIVTGILQDTVLVKIEFPDNLTALKKLFLIEKTKPVFHKEFTYKVENIKNKLQISFVNVSDIQTLITPIVPPKPLVDTIYKYQNNVLGHFCELKNDKAIYFNNIPKQGVCENPMPNEYLNYIAILMTKTEVPDDKYNLLENVFRNNCVSIQQTNTLIKYIEYEVEKLKLIKLAYYSFTDKNNVKNLESSFKFESSKKELQNYLASTKSSKQLVNSQCTKPTEDIEIKMFTDKLNASGNDAERYDVLKKLYENYCYSSTQAKQVLQTFLHDREKFEALKLLYYHCVDKQNYATLSDVFSYKQTENDLKDFIEKQK